MDVRAVEPVRMQCLHRKVHLAGIQTQNPADFMVPARFTQNLEVSKPWAPVQG